MFDASAAGGGGSTGSRYVYLLTRLRNRQITMEEATELFTIMQGIIRNIQSGPPPPAPGDSGTPPPPPPPPGGSRISLGEDADWLMVLGLGAGAGLAAALAKRMSHGMAEARSGAPPKTSPP